MVTLSPEVSSGVFALLPLWASSGAPGARVAPGQWNFACRPRIGWVRGVREVWVPPLHRRTTGRVVHQREHILQDCNDCTVLYCAVLAAVWISVVSFYCCIPLCLAEAESILLKALNPEEGNKNKVGLQSKEAVVGAQSHRRLAEAEPVVVHLLSI